MEIGYEFFIIIFGLIANIITLFVLMKRKFKSISARNILCALTLADSLKLSSIILFYHSGIVFRYVSEFCCRLQRYTEAFTTALSIFLITFSAIEKFISIKYSKFKFNRNLIILIITSIDSIYSVIFAILAVQPIEKSTLSGNNTNITQSINISFNCTSHLILFPIETVFSQLIPFLITFLFSCLLIHTIFESRLKFFSLTSPQDRKRLKRDIIFAITTLIINLTYILLNWPLYIILILIKNINIKLNKQYQSIASQFHHAAFGINFIILLISNSIFRHQFLSIFRYTKQSQSSTFQAALRS